MNMKRRPSRGNLNRGGSEGTNEEHVGAERGGDGPDVRDGAEEKAGGGDDDDGQDEEAGGGHEEAPGGEQSIHASPRAEQHARPERPHALGPTWRHGSWGHARRYG